MTDLRMQLEAEGTSVTVRLHGSFDGASARELERTLRALGPCEVVLDFSGVQRFADLAAGILAQALENPRTLQLRLRGLPDHPARVLRYCGIGERPSTRAAYWQPEP